MYFDEQKTDNVSSSINHFFLSTFVDISFYSLKKDIKKLRVNGLAFSFEWPTLPNLSCVCSRACVFFLVVIVNLENSNFQLTGTLTLS